MANQILFAQGATGDTVSVFPGPVVAQRAPTTSDRGYPVGQTWIDQSSGIIYQLASVSNNSASWSTAPTSLGTNVASLTVDTTAAVGTNLTVGGTLAVTGQTTLGNLSVSGTFAYGGAGAIAWTTSAAQANAIALNATAGGIDLTSGGGFDMDLTSSGGINIISNEDAANAITIEADGGTTETIYVHADQGTSATSIHLESDDGGVTLTSGLATAGAMRVNSQNGGFDLDAALQVNIASSQNAADALRFNASAGGIDIDANGAPAQDIDIRNTGGSIRLTATESATDAINIESTAGGVNVLASGAAAGEDINIFATGSSVNVRSTENSDGAIYIRENGGANGRIRLHADQGTAADSVFLESDAGGITATATAGAVVVNSGSDAADSIYLHANAGTSETIRLHSDQGTGEASVGLVSDVGGITLTAGLAGDAINFDATAGSVTATSGEDAADSIYLHADAGTSETIRLRADQGTGEASVGLVSDVGGITLTAGLAGDAINLDATAGSITLESGEDAADSIYLHANAGTSETVRLHSDQGTGTASVHLESDVGGVTLTGGLAGDAVNFVATNGSIVGTSGEDAADSIYLRANAGTSEKIRIHADQGTATDSIKLQSDAGGITLNAGSAANGITFENATSSPQLFWGTADPSGSVTGTAGDLYIRTGTGSADTALYVNTDAGGGTNWTPLTS